MDKAVDKRIHELYLKVHETNMELNSLGMEHIIFSWQWWLTILMIIVPWTLWFIFHKKESSARLLFAGFTTIIIASFLDFLGVAYGIWVYLVDVIFTIPAFIVWDFSLLPVTVMFSLQIKPTFNPFFKGIIFAAFLSFVGEPVTVWLGLYDPLEWKYIYSFPIYIFIYLIMHYISRRTTFEPLEKSTVK